MYLLGQMGQCRRLLDWTGTLLEIDNCIPALEIYHEGIVDVEAQSAEPAAS